MPLAQLISLSEIDTSEPGIKPPIVSDTIFKVSFTLSKVKSTILPPESIYSLRPCPSKVERKEFTPPCATKLPSADLSEGSQNVRASSLIKPSAPIA